jgi:lipopolysaccharide exporter
LLHQNLNKQLAKSSMWMVALRFCEKSISIVSTIILARLLSPDDFGLVALAVSVYAMIELIRTFGFDTVLIQNQKAERVHYDTAWTMQVIFSLLAGLLIFAISWPAANFYNDKRLIQVLWVMSVIIMVNGFDNIGVVDFRKNFTFNKEFTFKLLIKVTGFLVTLPLAWFWRNYWALLVGMFSTKIASILLSYALNDYRPLFTLRAWRELLSFSSWLLLNNFLLFINQHTQNFILARFIGAGAVGFFSIANEIATISSVEIVAPINRATYPGYAKVANDKRKLKEIYLKVLAHIAVISIPCSIGIAVLAPVLVPVLFGESWMEVIPNMQIIAFANAFVSLGTNVSYILLALKQQKINAVLSSFRILLFLPLLFFLIPSLGLDGVGVAIFFMSATMFPIYLYIMNKYICASFFNIVEVLYRPVIASLVMMVCVHSYVQVIRELSIWLLVSGLIIGMLTYTFALVIGWFISGRPKSVEYYVMSLILRKLRS